MVDEGPRNQLGELAESLIADVLDKRERGIINDVMTALDGGSLTPESAVQYWYALAESRRLRTALIRRSKTENARYIRTHERTEP